MTDLGRVRPAFGYWRWPYRQMQEGDEFHVSYEDRAPEDVRQLASVRAAQLGIRLSCRRDDEAGIMRITRVPFDTDPARGLPKALEYVQVRPLMRNLYSLNADAIPWGKAIEAGESFEYPAVRKGDDPRWIVECIVADHHYAVELLQDRIVVTHMGDMSLKDWQETQLRAMLD